MYKVLNASASRVCVSSGVRVRGICVAAVGLVFLFAAGGVRAQQTINVPAAQPTIQSGINAANNGDTVLVAPGTYIENINFNGKAITVTSSGGASATIIDGGAKGSVVTFQTSETASAVLSGFTIRNGLDIYGGGGIYIADASPTITGNVITQNHASVGCGIYVYGGSPVIQSNTITSNDQNNAGSVETGGGGIAVAGGGPRIIGNTIMNNSLSGGLGGGISLDGSNALVENNLIQGNSTNSGNGGGAAIFNSGSPLLIQNLIVANSALFGNGGAYTSFPRQIQQFPYKSQTTRFRQTRRSTHPAFTSSGLASMQVSRITS